MAKKIKKKNSNKNIKKNNEKLDDKFDFDNEIVIGVTRLPDDKNKSKAKSKNKKSDKKKKNNKKIAKKQEEKVIKNDFFDYEQNEEKVENVKNNSRVIKYMILLVLIVFVIIAVMFSPLFDIKQITVVGNSKLTEDEIISLSKIEKGENTYKVNKIDVIKNIKENAYIENVQVNRKLPSEIEIVVEERKATFLLEYGGSFVYLNNQGYILEISGRTDLPILQGQATEDKDLLVGSRLLTEDLQKMSMVLKIMEQAEANGFASLITKIDISNKESYKLILESEKKTVYLGDCSNLGTRMLNVKAIIEKEKGIEGEIFVDMDLNSAYPTFRQKV